MSDTNATRVIKKEDVERNTPGNPVEIPYVQIQEESTDRGQIGIKLPNGTKISVTEIHRTANKELFLMHSIAADRSLHDLGLTPKAKKYETAIKKVLIIMKDNQQSEPVQDAVEDQAKRAAYDKAKTRMDKLVEKRNETVLKMFTTLKSYMHESIRPTFEDIILQKMETTPWIDLQGNTMNEACEYTLAGYKMCWMFFYAYRFPTGCSRTATQLHAIQVEEAQGITCTCVCRTSSADEQLHRIPAMSVLQCTGH